MTDLQERIAQELWASDRYGYQNRAGGDEISPTFADHDTNGRANYLAMASRILNLPEIKAALVLLEERLVKEGGGHV